VDAFLAGRPAQRNWLLGSARQFFAFARNKRIILVDPTKTLAAAREPFGFRGKTVDLPRQRQLFHRWTTSREPHPHEALVGLLALLHGVSSQEARLLLVDDIDPSTHRIQLGQRPSPTSDSPAWATNSCRKAARSPS